MKRFSYTLLLIYMLLTLSSCGKDEIHVTTPTPIPKVTLTATPTPTSAPITEFTSDGFLMLSGKIAIVTNSIDQNEEEYRSVEFIQAKYGKENIIHCTWPLCFTEQTVTMANTLKELAADPEVKVLIINQAVFNTNTAVDVFIEDLGSRRPDVFIKRRVYLA